ncbi:sulfatase-like hydrolase/transferase, partial [Acinetobacter baumannii]|uniref:sulfatase-like hydrolase/transferase n=1 Tax=Acinetobacter baumannii TaxID=470 RepID=UPI002091CFE8
MNVYDNTILYTDHFLTKVIELLKRNADKRDTAMIYVSDHGEALGENGVYLHAAPYSIAPQAQIHVPMV